MPLTECAIYCVKKPFFALHSYCIGGIVIGGHGKGCLWKRMAVSDHIKNNIMITVTGGDLEIKLWVVHDSFSTRGVAWKKFGNQYFFVLSVKHKQLKA